MMRMSPAGIAALRTREGCVLKAYHDSVGVPTIGVGHTGRASPPAVKVGDTITLAQADAYLAADLAPFEAALNRVVTAKLGQNQIDACLSLAFNIGEGGFVGSTVVHKINAGDLAGAADAFLMWDRPAVLKTRRIGERAQFLRADDAPISMAAPAVTPPAAVHGALLPPSPAAGFLTRLHFLFTGRDA